MADAESITLPPRVKDQRDNVFGRLTVIEFAGLITKYDGRRESQWLCRCQCGNTKTVRLTDLLASKGVKSCGCLKTEATAAINKRHGMSRSRVYEIWCGMIKRCENKNHQAYDRYGGRGITVCDSWRMSFETFLADMGEPPTAKHTLERKENDKGYNPDNCKWATYREQGRNTRRNIVLTFRGRTQSLPAWCDELKLPYPAIKKRLYSGWSVTKALSTPISTPALLTVGDTTLTISEWANKTGLRSSCIHGRLMKGCTPTEAISPSRRSQSQQRR